ncbi:MAG: GNAT family N-acetyltransferase [Promethearchaeia archaeon]
MDIVIKHLGPDVIEDFLYFFDEVGFIDNPNWASCYCHYYHFDGSREDWGKRTKIQNRDATKALILSGKMKGFLAYSDGKPIGWCNANSRQIYSYLPVKDAHNEEEKVASVVCFLITPHYRKKGIARMLLKEACEYYKIKKYNYIEAYPVKEAKSDAHNYHGPISLFRSEGFSVIKELKDFFVMRKQL